MKDKFIYITFVTLLLIFGVVILWKNNNTIDNAKIMFNEDNAKLVEYTLPDGTVANAKLYIVDKEVGTGTEVVDTSTVKVHYRGWLEDGTEFDKTINANGSEIKDPISFPLSGVIEGWRNGLQGMKVGGTRYLKIPAELGYGANQNGLIPANSILYFEVKLLEVL